MNFEWLKDFFSNIPFDKTVPTVLVVLIILLKLLINQKVTRIKFKESVVSVPGEIVFLVLGFLSGSLIITRDKEAVIYTLIVISFILLCIVYAVERWIMNKLIGKLKWYYVAIEVLMYLLSSCLYVIVVFGGLY